MPWIEIMSMNHVIANNEGIQTQQISLADLKNRIDHKAHKRTIPFLPLTARSAPFIQTLCPLPEALWSKLSAWLSKTYTNLDMRTSITRAFRQPTRPVASMPCIRENFVFELIVLK
jgi:hypothetical protein